MLSPQSKPRVKEAVERFVARVRHNMDVHLETLAADLVKVIQEEGSGHVNVERLAEMARSASALQAHEGKIDALAKIVGAMRLLDEAISLKGILEALGRGAAGEATRVSVSLVDATTLRHFNDYGYSTGPRPTDLPLESFGDLARAVGDRQRIAVGTSAGSRPVDVPAFMRPQPGHSGVVIPVVVANAVVAIVYAEGPDRQGAQTAPSPWIEHVEVLVRHASSRLENVTSRRTVEVLTKPA